MIISEQELELFCPESQSDQLSALIGDADTLYRRCQPNHFDENGDLIPAFFKFPNKMDKAKSGQSFLLKRIASAFHVLHRNCNEGKRLAPGEWRVLELAVSSIPKSIADPESKTFYFRPIHAPYATCMAHCELFCSDRSDSSKYVIPGTVVRMKLRIELARKFKTTDIELIVQ